MFSVFVIAYLCYLVMILVPAGIWVEYTPHQLLQTHLLPYAKYVTPFSSHDLRLDYYTIAEYYSAGVQLASSFWVYGQLLLFGGVLSVVLAITTYLRSFWFWIAQGMFAALLYSCNLQHVRLGGRVDLLPYVLLLLLLVFTAWCVHLRGRHLLLHLRVLFFVALFTIVGLAVNYFSVEESPFLILAHHIYYPQLFLTLLFCLFVGHEIPYLFLRLSSSVSFGRSGQQFLLIFLLYMLYLICLYLYNTGHISWNPRYLDEFIFLGVSAVVGFWGVQQRSHFYSYLLSPVLQRMVYLLWAVLSLMTISYMRRAGNDPALEVFEDSILFGHIGFGLGFLVYIIYNFYTPLLRNLAVWRIVYQPGVGTPFMVTRVLGLLVLLVCYLLSAKAAYNHAISGEKLQLAKLYARQSLSIARMHYEEAAVYGYQSHGPNYALGQGAFLREDYYTAASYYRSAVAKHPSPQAYLNLGNTLQALQLPEEALTAWKEGFSRFRSSYLANNLAFYYLQQGSWDSAAYYARLVGRPAIVNLAAAEALESERPKVSTTVMSMSESTNRLAAALRHSLLPVAPLDTSAYRRAYGLAYMHNYVLALLRHDAALARDNLQCFSVAAKDPAFAHDLKRLQAFSEAAVGHTDRALRLLDQIGGVGSRHAGFYAYVAGLWTYAVGGYSRAAEYFLESYDWGYTASMPIGLQATAMLPEGRLKAKQLTSWKKLRADTTQYWKYVTESPFELLEGDTKLEPLLAACTKAPRLVLPLVQRLLDKGQTQLATELLRLAPASADSSIYPQLLQAECLFATEDSASLAKELRSLSQDIPHYQYIRYLLSPSEVSADKLLHNVKEYPFQQQLVLRASDALERKGYSLRAYELLLSALETNPYAAALQEAYIWQATRLGQTAYAEDALTDLEQLLSASSYAAFLRKYRTFVQQQAVVDAEWK